jgi:hypothetical protein
LFALDAYKQPYPSPEDFTERDAKRCKCRVVVLGRDYSVKYPAEAQGRVECYCSIVDPDLIVYTYPPKKLVVRVCMAKIPIVVHVPEAGGRPVDYRSGDGYDAIGVGRIHPIHAQRSVH